MSLETLRRAFDLADRHGEHALDLAHRSLVASGAALPLVATGNVGGAISRSGFLSSNIQSRNQYNRNTGWVYAAIRVRAERIAGQPIHVGIRVRDDDRKQGGERRTKPGGTKRVMPRRSKSLEYDDVEILDEHPLVDLLRNPNPYMTAHSLLAVTVASLDLTGKAYWWMTEDDGVRNLWYLPASWVTPKHSQTDLFAEYEIRPGDSTEMFLVPGDEVMYIYEPDPADPLKSLSKLQAAARPIQTDEMIQETQRKTFINGINPLVMVVMGRLPNTAEMPGTVGIRPTVSADMKARIQSGILQQFQSAANFGKPIIADQDIEKIEFLNRPPAEMGFVDSSKLTKERILQVWGVSEISIGQMQNSNRAGAAMADALLVSGSVNPTAALISEAMSAWLGPWYAEEGEELCVWIEPAIPIDAELDLKRDESMVKLGTMMLDEWRLKSGMSPLPNGQGQILLIPNTHKAVRAGEEYVDGQDDVEEGGEQDPVLDDSEEESVKHCWFKRLGEKGAAEVWTRTHDRLSKRMEADLGGLFKEMAADIANEYVKSGGGASANDLVNQYIWQERLVAKCRPHLQAAAVTGATLAFELYRPRKRRASCVRGRKDVSLPQYVIDAINQFVSQLLNAPFWAEIGETVKASIVGILSAGVESGASIATIAAELKEVIGVGNSQAINIANTEVTGAMNAGQQATYVELSNQGVIIGRRWLVIVDGRTRPSHMAANGQARPVNEPFLVGGEEGMFPGDMNFSAKERCQCILPGARIDGVYDHAFRSLYSGKAVEIVTVSGRRLSLTPNHPILTECGWILAGKLDVGKKLVAYGSEIDLLWRSGADQIDYVPAKIEEVFEAFVLRSVSCGHRSHAVEVVRAEMDDFNGDGKFLDANIEIVRSYGELLHCGVASRGNQSEDGIFGLEYAEPTDKLRHSNSGLGVFGLRQACGGSPSSGTLSLDERPVGFDFRPLDSLGIAGSAWLDSGGIEVAYKGDSGDSTTVRNLLHRNAGKMFLDEIVEVRNYEFRGHVYCLQGEHGLIVANGIVNSNCRCTMLSVLPGESMDNKPPVVPA